MKTHRLDNKASTAYKECIRNNGMTHKLVPPDNHRSILAERAIQTFKHHFISILSSVDDKFPLSLWCALLEQTELTVNLLGNPTSYQKYQRSPTCTASTTTRRSHLHQLGAQSKYTSSPETDERGMPTPKPDRTLAHQWSTTDVSRFTSPKPEQQESATWYFSSTSI